MENQTITVTDLNLLKNIIDLASTRGAFRAEELKEVGEVYNKLVLFLNAVIAQAKEQGLEDPSSEQSQGE